MAAKLGTIALITMVRSSDNESPEASELIKEIRGAIQSSKISKSWTIEKITILGESEASTASLSPTPPNKNSTAP